MANKVGEDHQGVENANMNHLKQFQTLLDKQEITEVLYRSLRNSDEKRYDNFAECYGKEIIIDFGGVKPPQKLAPADLAAWARQAYALVKTQHMVFNVEVTVDGNVATSASCGHALHERSDTGDFWHIYPRYEHEYIKTAEGWKISRIRMTPAFEEGNSNLLQESWAAENPAE